MLIVRREATRQTNLHWYFGWSRPRKFDLVKSKERVHSTQTYSVICVVDYQIKCFNLTGNDVIVARWFLMRTGSVGRLSLGFYGLPSHPFPSLHTPLFHIHKVYLLCVCVAVHVTQILALNGNFQFTTHACGVFFCMIFRTVVKQFNKINKKSEE